MTSCKQLLFAVGAMLAVNVYADVVLESIQKKQVQVNHVDKQADKSSAFIAHYLWDEEVQPEADSNNNKDNEKLAGYLWDKDGSGYFDDPDLQISNFLWDEIIGDDVLNDSSYQGEANDLDLPRTASYLWDEDTGISPQDSSNRPDLRLSQFLWDDGDTYQTIASLNNELIIEPTIKRFIIVANNLDKLRSDLSGRDITILEEFDIIKSIGVAMSKAELDGLKKNRNIISIVEDGTVETADIKYSAKGDGELKFKKKKVSWEIYNLGNENLKLSQFELAWPAANGALKRVKVGGKVIYKRESDDDDDGDDKYSIVQSVTDTTALINVSHIKIEKNKGRKITLVFSNPAAVEQEGYDISVGFKHGLTIDYAYHASLPNQGRRRDTFYPSLIDADMLHVDGVTGSGVGVAIIDTGTWNKKSLSQNTKGQPRISAFYDAIENRTTLKMSDDNGHGTHIASVISSSQATLDLDGNVPGSYHGIAPDANLVIVRAFDKNGRGTYMDVVRAIAYVIAHKQEYNIRVLNLSFGATPGTHYWQDPINLAVMAAWRAGIVVIVSAGNKGPDPMSIGVPGNVPYVVTVGAMTDHYTPDDLSDDYLASFSSSGPTMEGFVKPEITAPGGHMMGIMNLHTTIATEHPEFHDGYTYFLMSGTSQAAAVASGVAALMLQDNPALSPDDVKCRLMSSARAATNADGSLAYSVFQQGTGLVNAWDAVHSTASDCVNIGLDIDQDLAGLQHFGGPANVDENGDFYLTTTEGFIWNLNDVSNSGFIWNLNDLSNLGFIWNLGYVWDTGALEENGFIWNLSDFQSNGFIWNLAQLEQDGFIWNLSNPQSTGNPGQNNGFIWNLADASNDGFIWNLNNAAAEGYIWNLGNIEGANFVWNMAFTASGGYIWNMGYTWNTNDPENAGFIWNLGDTQNAGFIWNLSNPEGAGFIWNLADAGNTGFIWNLNNVSNDGFIWNLRNATNEGFIWNLNSAESQGYIWNLSAAQNAGFIWNLADASNDGFIWNLSEADNTGFIWNLNSPDSTGFIWNLNASMNNGFIWNLNDTINEGFIWNLNDTINEGFIWNLNGAENEGFIWNLNGAENEGFIWNLNGAENEGFIWNLNDVENEGFIWNLSAMGINNWVTQE